jgi:CRP-like cAMP-binding protein
MFGTPVFAVYKRDLLVKIAELLEFQFFKKGENLMVENEIGNSMHIILDGKCSIFKLD